MASDMTKRAPRSDLPFWLTALACLAICVLRDLPGALSPPVRLEDAVYMLSFYWQDTDPANILRYYAGYVSIGPNLVGYVAGNAPGTVGIYILHWVPLVMAACAFATITLRDVDVFGLSLRDRALLAIVLAVLPLANFALLTNTTYMLWSMLIMSSLLAVFWTPRPGFGSVILFGLLALTSMSHPLFILLAPVLALRVIFAATGFERIGFALILVLAFGYLALLVDFSGTGEGMSEGLLPLIADALRMFTSRAVAEPILSSWIRFFVINRGGMIATIAFGCVVALIGLVLLWRARATLSRAHLWQLLALLVLAVLFTSASTATGRAILETSWAHRYVYPSVFFVMLALLWGLLKLLYSLPRGLRGLGFAMAAVWIAVLNWADVNFYRSDATDRRTTYDLVAEAARLSDLGTPYCLIKARDTWTIRLAEGVAEEGPCPASSAPEG